MVSTRARRRYAITRNDDISGYVCVHLPAAMDKNSNTDLTEDTDLAFSLIFLLVVNGYWIILGIFLDLRVLGHSPILAEF